MGENRLLVFRTGIDVNLITDFPLTLTDEDYLFFDAYLPGFEKETIGKGNASSLVIKLHESNVPKIIQNGLNLEWYDKWAGKLNLDFFHAFYGMMRLALIDRRLFPTHAACVGNKDKGFSLLAAYPSNGKTSTVLDLVNRYNVKIFSCDKTVMSLENGALRAVAGTHAVTARYSVFEKYSPSLLNFQYLNRGGGMLPPEYYEDKPMVPIENISIIRADPAVSEYEDLNPVNASHKLFPFFMDLTNADKIIYAQSGQTKGMVDGNIPLKIKRELAENLATALKTVNIHLITGSVPFISDCLMKE